eukprot:TRINITY_DN5146_c0_g1_i1.p1 TRINITY_DN5146_c0_g1~~TRINITY_DN5146_c0_g1_i1.p1  ORF type:complete len:675 (-),score=72.84 TRINITY_DN5146_c0_g1_i1:577-2601(-)
MAGSSPRTLHQIGAGEPFFTVIRTMQTHGPDSDPTTWRELDYLELHRSDFDYCPEEFNAQLDASGKVMVLLTAHLIRISRMFCGGWRRSALFVGPPSAGKSTSLFVLHALAKAKSVPHVYFPLRNVFDDRFTLWEFFKAVCAKLDAAGVQCSAELLAALSPAQLGGWLQVSQKPSDPAGLNYGQLYHALIALVAGTKFLLLLDQYNIVFQRREEAEELQVARQQFRNFWCGWVMVGAVSSSFPDAFLVFSQERSGFVTTGFKQQVSISETDVDALLQAKGMSSHKDRLKDIAYTLASVNALELLLQQNPDADAAYDALETAYLDYYHLRIASLSDPDKYVFTKRSQRISFNQQLMVAVQFLRGSWLVDTTSSWFTAGLIVQPDARKRPRGCSPVCERALFKYFLGDETRTRRVTELLMAFNQTAWYGLELAVQSMFDTAHYPKMVTVHMSRLTPKSDQEVIVQHTVMIKRKVFFEDLLASKTPQLLEGDYIVLPEGFPVIDFAVFDRGIILVGQISRSFYVNHDKKVWSLFVKYFENKSIIQLLAKWAGISVSTKSYYRDDIAAAKQKETFPKEFLYCYFTSTYFQDNRTSTDFLHVNVCDARAIAAVVPSFGTAVTIMADRKRKRQQLTPGSEKKAAIAGQDEQLPGPGADNPKLDADDPEPATDMDLTADIF